MNAKRMPTAGNTCFPFQRNWTLPRQADCEVTPQLNAAWHRSQTTLEQIREALQSEPAWPGVETIYIVGSLGRMEQVRGSDCDLVVVLGDSDSPSDPAVQHGLDTLWQRLEALGMQRPKPNGIYANPTSTAALWNPASVGQVNESMDVFGKRIQLLLEGQPVYAEQACVKLLERMLHRYAGGSQPQPSVSSDNNKQWSYLLNDLIRYFRSLCVRTQWLSDPRQWILLNTKLRHSRLLAYAALLLLIGHSSTIQHDKVAWLAARMRLTPLERIASVFLEYNCSAQFANIMHRYDTFLSAMDSRVFQHKPEQQALTWEDWLADSDYQSLKHNSSQLIGELLQFVLDRRDDWDARFFEYLIF